MSIAVTAATGHLGRLVIAGLVAEVGAQKVVAVVRDHSKTIDVAAAGVEVRVADYDDADGWAAAFDGVDRALLISGSSLGQRVEQHERVIDAARLAGLDRIVYTSLLNAGEAEFNPISPDHAATETYLREADIPFTILRNGFYTEVYLRELEAARKTGRLVTGAGRGAIASATRADLAQAAVRVLTGTGHEGKTYEFGASPGWTMDELGWVISEIIELPVDVRHVDADAHREILAAAGLHGVALDFTLAIEAAVAVGELDTKSTDLERILGRPPVGLREGLEAAAHAQH